MIRVLLIEKTLDENDVDPSQNRLLIPFKILKRHDFLTSDEMKILGDDSINNEGRMGVGAFLVDQRTSQWNVVLKKCVLKYLKNLILKYYTFYFAET
ncbi:hypothetical protein EUTSA_v10022269mg [Eutrema salsugineum]|uniref:Uncharacterized protein n=1 Tax=Eutrema salsugineum TaxID=72664 RepID=V4NSM2_EUTSA|nr:hypothetical protein EUTSA_v10022269mg [Eutrema salsugineum]